MSSPTKPDYYADFNKDFANFQTDLNDYTDLQGDSTSLNSAYNSELNGINWDKLKASNNPWLVLMTVMHLVLDPGTNMINNKIDMTGQESECQTALSKCQTDLQDLTAQKGNGTNGLTEEAHGLDKLLNELKTPLAQNVFGADGAADVSNNLLTVRQQIYLGDGSEYDPASATAPGVYFTLNGANGTMTSYGQMIDGMSDQGNQTAIQANTKLSNAFGTNTSILQSVQQKTKEELTEWINLVKTLASAGSMFGHAVSQVSSSAEQNMRPQ